MININKTSKPVILEIKNLHFRNICDWFLIMRQKLRYATYMAFIIFFKGMLINMGLYFKMFSTFFYINFFFKKRKNRKKTRKVTNRITYLTLKKIDMHNCRGIL